MSQTTLMSAFQAVVATFEADSKPNWAECLDYKPELLEPTNVVFDEKFAPYGLKPCVTHNGVTYSCPIWDGDAEPRYVNGKQTLTSKRRQVNRDNWIDFKYIKENVSLEAALDKYSITLKIEILTNCDTENNKVDDLRHMSTCALK